MDAKELRIGNLVNRLGRLTKITAIQINSDGMGFVCTPLSGAITVNQIEPIELIEEWILKFGFEKVKAHNNFYWFILNLSNDKNSFLPFLMYDPKDKITTLVECVSEANILVIKYVHQLQNLFFALTGEELTLK